MESPEGIYHYDDMHEIYLFFFGCMCRSLCPCEAYATYISPQPYAVAATDAGEDMSWLWAPEEKEEGKLVNLFVLLEARLAECLGRRSQSRMR